MQSVYGYFDGKTIVLPDYINCRKNQRVLITLLESEKDVKYLGKIDDDNYEILLEALSKGEVIDYEYDDPFFSLENIKHLTKTIRDIDSGRAKLTEHELIEVDEDE